MPLRLGVGEKVVTALVVAVALAGGTAWGAVAGTGDVLPVNPATWTSATIGYVGNTTVGGLTVNSGSPLNSATGYVGFGVGSSGTVGISGVGSKWTDTGILYVGEGGSGVLNVTNSGAVTNTSSYIGDSATGAGTVAISGVQSVWSTSGTLTMGNSGKGAMNITSGATVSTGLSYLAFNAASSGTVLVDGMGSKWTSGDLYVGSAGTGTMSVTGGGTVTTNGSSIVGNTSSGTGTVIISGTRSVWAANGGLTLGYSGTGTMNIVNGATVSCFLCYLGFSAGSFGTLVIDGAGSKWTNSGDLYAGYNGTGTLSILNGGIVSVTGTTYVAYAHTATGSVNFGAQGGTLTSKSLFAASGQLTGTGTINLRGIVSDVDLTFDATHGLTQNLALSGAGQNIALHLDLSTSSTVGDLGVGYDGVAKLIIRDGRKVPSVNAYLGYGQGSNGSATVDGAGSAWNCSVNFYVGNSGLGTLNIFNGGAVAVTGKTYLGATDLGAGAIDFGTSGGTLTTRSLYAGAAQFMGTGTINTRGLIQDGNWVFDSSHGLIQTLAWLGNQQNVTVHVDMTGGSSVVGDLGVGYMDGGTLTIRDGQTVNSGLAFLGYHGAATGTALVDGAPSTWTTSGNFNAGYSGNAYISIVNGGKISSPNSYLGYSAGASGTAVIDGTGSTWTNSGSVYVGNSGAGNMAISRGGNMSASGSYVGYNAGSTGTVLVTNGGTVSSSGLDIGEAVGSTGDVTLDGVGSVWATTGIIHVGYNGDGLLNVTNGGKFSNSQGTFLPSIYLGYGAGASGTARIDGAGSLLSNVGKNNTVPLVYVGYSGTGSLSITNGGKVAGNIGLEIGYNASGVGRVEVDGASSVQAIDVTVGYQGSGFMSVRHGGSVSGAAGTWIGEKAGSSGELIITGAGSVWSIGYMYVGIAGAGRLTIADGGKLTCTNFSYLGGDGGKGTATVDGAGSIWINNIEGIGVGLSTTGTGMMEIVNGGAVNVLSFSINTLSLLAMNVGDGSSLTIGNRGIANSGVIQLTAVPNAAAGTYTPLTAASWSGSGTTTALGGTWNSSNRTFSVSAATIGGAGETVIFDRSVTQRVKITDATADKQVWLAFQGTTTSSSLTLAAERLTDVQVAELQGQVGNETVLEGWNFTTSGYTSGQAVGLSIEVGAGYTTDMLTVWHFDGATWTSYAADDLSYDGTYASFTVTGFSGYAVVNTSAAVPEVETVGVLGVGMVAMMRRRRKIKGKRGNKERI